MRRRHVQVLYDLMRIPKPATGSQSSTIKGFVGHSKDAAHAMDLAQRLLLATLMGPEPEDLDETPDAVAEEARLWLEKRKMEDWQ